MIAVNRLANGHGPTLAYVKKRTGGTKADLDTLRRLKRYIAREVYPLLRDALSDQGMQCPKPFDGYRRFGDGRLERGAHDRI